MALSFETFNNLTGGQCFFKAIGHPAAAGQAYALLKTLESYHRLAIYDPLGHFSSFQELYDTTSLKISGLYGQRYENLGQRVGDHTTQLITDLKECDALFILSFEAHQKKLEIKSLLPEGLPVYSLEDIKLENQFLTNPKRYLDPLNFATNFAFFRDQGGLHTRLVTANYWSGYSGKSASLKCLLLDENGHEIADWTQDLGDPYATVTLDSRDIRQKFQLNEFCGQLFLHVVGAAGHDIVKYALDIFGPSSNTLSCTHDANAWPADFYAGLPAPQEDETVLLWIQNSHPCPIPAGAIGLNVMGQEALVRWPEPLPPYASKCLDVSTLFPKVKWPQQLEIRAGKYFVRPRYEIVKKASQKRHIAHANVERKDLQPNPVLKQLTPFFGKGFILPAPLLPSKRWKSIVLPTPMATTQQTLPLALEIFTSQGERVLHHSLGGVRRSASQSISIDDLLKDQNIDLADTYGHMELMYDFEAGDQADGWLHGLFRYESRLSDHTAESSFGSHIFNTMITYKDQPLSYRGTPPGLSTRLFLRLGPQGYKTHYHLIYPVSKKWYDFSSTEIQLKSSTGQTIATKELKIVQSGSYYGCVQDQFSEQDLAQAGKEAYIIIRDETCRLFGYHGLLSDTDAFSLDHMFGF